MPAGRTLFLFLSWLSFINGKSLGDEPCKGTQKEDFSYDFVLPNAVALNVKKDACDAEWTVDGFTAFLEGNVTNYSHPFKNVTRHGISVKYCPVSVKYHVSCPIYTRDLTCLCTNNTYNNPSRDISSSDSTKRHHYCAIGAAATFVVTVVILAFFICRPNRTAS